MKQPNLKYYSKKYDGLYGLFMQRSLIMMFLKDIIKDESPLQVNLEVDAWRYVFEKDISKSRLIKNLTLNGKSNLEALEIVNKLNNICKVVDEILEKEK